MADERSDGQPRGPSAGARRATIYDVALAAGVAASTVSRALSRPGRVSFETAERVRAAAAATGYRSTTIRRQPSGRGSLLLAMVVADIANPVFLGMIRGAERTAGHAGYTLVVVETQESERAERDALARVLPAADGTILASSRLPDRAIRDAAKQKPMVVLNRSVSQVTSLASDNVRAVKKACEHLVASGVRSISYLAGPEASWADGMRWRGLREAALELDLRVHRLGPHAPTLQGGAAAARTWLGRPTAGVIAYNDLLAIGFLRAVTAAGVRVPDDVGVIGFDDIVDGRLVTPSLTTIASPLVSLGSAAVNHLIKRTRSSGPGAPAGAGTTHLPARLVVRESTRPGN